MFQNGENMNVVKSEDGHCQECGERSYFLIQFEGIVSISEVFICKICAKDLIADLVEVM